MLYASGDVNVQSLYQQYLIPGFQKKNPGIKVKFIFSEHGTQDTTTLARIGAAVKQRKWSGFDIVDAGLVTTLATDGLTQPVSKATAPNIKNVDQKLLTPVKGAAIPYRGSSVVLAYDSKNVTSPPKSLGALLAWIKANPGKFTYNSPNSGGSGYSFAETVVDSYISASVLKQMQQGYVPNLESNWKQGLDALHEPEPVRLPGRLPEREPGRPRPAGEGPDLGGPGVVGPVADRSQERAAAGVASTCSRSRTRRSPVAPPTSAS